MPVHCDDPEQSEGIRAVAKVAEFFLQPFPGIFSTPDCRQAGCQVFRALTG